MEIASALARHSIKVGSGGQRQYEKWDLQFWADILYGKLNVRRTGQPELLRARNLMRYAGVVKRRNLWSADALIASACLELALERREHMIFYTSDWTLFDVIRQIDAFTSVLKINFLGIPKVPI